MARRRRAPVRAKTRRVYVKAKRKSYRKTGMNPKSVILPAMVYGGVRAKASNLLAPLTSKIPLGSIADEVVMAGVSYMMAKKGKGMIKKVGLAGLTIESARLGEAVATGQLGSLTGNSSASSAPLLG